MNWNVYASRRKIDVQRWLDLRGIVNRESFLEALTQLNIEPPDDDQLLLMFPAPVISHIDEVKDEPIAYTPERIDQVASRSVVGEGNRANKRSDRKRAPKVRS